MNIRGILSGTMLFLTFFISTYVFYSDDIYLIILSQLFDNLGRLVVLFFTLRLLLIYFYYEIHNFIVLVKDSFRIVMEQFCIHFVFYSIKAWYEITNRDFIFINLIFKAFKYKKLKPSNVSPHVNVTRIYLYIDEVDIFPTYRNEVYFQCHLMYYGSWDLIVELMTFYHEDRFVEIRYIASTGKCIVVVPAFIPSSDITYHDRFSFLQNIKWIYDQIKCKETYLKQIGVGDIDAMILKEVDSLNVKFKHVG